MKKTVKFILFLLCMIGITIVLLTIVPYRKNERLHSTVLYTDHVTNQTYESIKDASIPLAASNYEPAAADPIKIESVLQPVSNDGVSRVEPASYTPATQNSAPVPSEDPKSPAEEAQEPEAAAEDPETPADSGKAEKPSDVKDITAMAKYLFDAATEFWVTEKDFCGTSTRPVSTRVASSIGAGTAVDCPGGDTTRIDKNGVAHDSYAIADHFREYVDMPDLQNFKIYLSDKDYDVNPYGAREDVTGAYYQYGSHRATYVPPVEDAAETTESADGAAEG